MPVTDNCLTLSEVGPIATQESAKKGELTAVPGLWDNKTGHLLNKYQNLNENLKFFSACPKGYHKIMFLWMYTNNGYSCDSVVISAQYTAVLVG